VTGLRRWVPLAAVVALLGAAMLAAVYSNPDVPLAPTESATFDQAPATEDVNQQRAQPTASALTPGGGDIPTWITYAISAVCAGLVLLLVGYLAWLAIRTRIARRRRPLSLLAEAVPTLEQTRRDVAAVIDAGLADLEDADADPRRAVIACWVRLEGAAATAGVERGVADTSSDLVARLLATHLVVRGDVLAAFAAIYRQARYAPHEVDTLMRERARAALVQLRAELAGSAQRPQMEPTI
jgi:Domain of unknown function (DUF4129)